MAIEQPMKSAYITFFLSVGLVAIGSGYYHLWPDNQTLFWDRLPMAIAFMSLFSIIIGEFISLRMGQVLCWPLISGGILSVVYWQVTELLGKGDLRYYAMVQFIPMILIPIILIFFHSKYTKAAAYGWLLLVYIVAKCFEYLDSHLYEISGVISGHSIKHLAAAVGIYVLLHAYTRRSKVR
jgi:hypothetical protein